MENRLLEAEQELKLLETAVDQAKEAVLITSARLDPPGPEVLFVNPAFTEMTGYSQEEILHKTPRILQGPKSDRAMLQRLREALGRGEPFSGETVNYRKDGSEYYVEWDITPIRTNSGQISHFLSIQRNVTARKLAENQLNELFRQVEKSRNDLLSILNELRIGTAMTDEKGHVLFLSAAAQQLFTRADVGMANVRWNDLFSLDPEDTAQLQALIQQPPEKRAKIPVHLDQPDGRRLWLEVDVKDDPRDPRGKIFFFYDVTDVHDLRRLLDERAQFHDLLGKSKAMQAVFQQIRDVARVDSTVLIEGETGTGKELVARAIHASSHRKDKPFIAVNCAGLTESLLASQLFGHKRGAFTGAIEDHQGLFEAANGGTLLLDEIGDIPMTVQNQLLRVLQEREIVRLGESRPRKIDVRVLAATHRSLAEEVAKGSFRSDLFYRIRVARIRVPPLRARREDIPLLAASFLAQFSAAGGKRVTELSHDALSLLTDYEWPGNVRELRSAIEFAVIRCAGAVIQPDDLPPEIFQPAEFESSIPGDPLADEKARFLQALERSRGNRALAARLLGISRATLYRRLADLKISSAEK
ncbi:MAG TPA: sigma 54-interacting transcriptional regulator [Candidatus Binatia bacterium]|nr:sigma 54-interacting transcriptional regulator [Candidatus Binatia bacterium]